VLVLDRGAVVFCGPPDELVSQTDMLDACGLEIPPFAVFSAHLRELGFNDSLGFLNPEDLVGGLCL
jgi:hypothetical protein